MKRRKHAVNVTAALAVIGALVTAYIQIDSHLMEKERMRAQLAYEIAVQECEDSGGKWYRGACEAPEEP